MSLELLRRRVARIAGDRESGASTLTAAAIGVLTDAFSEELPIAPLGRDLIRAQPSMASIWNAVRAALTAPGPEAFHHYAERSRRAGQALTRHAASLLLPETPRSPLRVVTISLSGTVLQVFKTLATACPLEVATAEGQPALEGRHMAEQLAGGGIAVTHFADPALGHALAGADAVLVGADAVTPDAFLNKSGTRMLAAAAAQQGVPVYVAATRDKFLSRAVAGRLEIREEPAAEVWAAPPAGVNVRNPYFEPTPLDLVSVVISDLGVLGAALVPDACPTTGDDLLLNL